MATKDNFFQTSDGLWLYYEVTGEGRPIVLIPGFGEALTIGGLEGSRLEATEMPVRRARPHGLLVAAIVAAALLLVGCAAAAYARIHMTYTHHEDITATISRTDDAEDKNVLTDCYPQTPCPGYVLSGGAPITTTGTTRSAAPFWSIPARIFSCTAWGNAPLSGWRSFCAKGCP